ncbi:putative flavoprotein involved in K+ transport [Xenococcus sp. PCC 7305]|uniref:FAD/NAD(P)-binding protein n=1 Tax=Xenococcus sp. PCC 7305 TaxID=102125 RepID=UPI0002ABA90F|nr:FAD/NAD(P)-binding protein [Xenococcus sp. PCC 7305]ELS00942.1 putative flavoprotein involved in K+ transport [Xenococcus sp. PCC 7305]
MKLPKYIDLAIVGAGVQALTLTTHLLQKRQDYYHKLLVFDPSQTWLSQWQRQFAAQQIPHLRSPAVHHPDPNPHQLRTFAKNRHNELFPPYDRPGTKLFNDFCHEVIHRWNLENKVYPAKVIHILPITLASRSRFRLILSTGETIIARRVVLATGSGKVQLPNWAERITSNYPTDKLCHSQQVNLNQLNLKGEKILIVGGGLTSGHLAKGAINMGATVTLMTRKQIQEKIFDADPGWLGPKYLKDFHAAINWNDRYQQIKQARNGGSMTPEIMLQLRRATREGKVIINECCQVSDAQWQDNLWQVNCLDGGKHQFNRIWLATGTRFNVTEHPLLQDVLETYPTKIVNGLPVLDEHLRLPKSNFFIMGGLAALRVGPVARNIGGGKMACQRIVPAIVKSSLAIG